MDAKYRARVRDGGGLGAGDSLHEAVTSLLINMTREADAIRVAMCEDILKNQKGWF